MLKTFDMKQTTTKEVLHTQGEWFFTEYNSIREPFEIQTLNKTGKVRIAILHWGISPIYPEQLTELRANAELICKAVNERQKLLALIDSWHEDVEKLSNSNKELLEALEEITEMALRWSDKGLTPTIYKAEKAINNAKNIQ